MDNKGDNNIVFLKIGQRIQYYRQKANLTQEKLAEKIGLTPNHLSRIESGRHNPYFETIMLAAKELDVPIDAFLEDIDDNYINTFLQMMKSDISGMSKNQLEMLKKYIALIKEFDF
ncbi:MAG: helix-turn-helix transcriptional regulator [bacterium]|nr:helix-turn-helix transcriptional regulator [bacterium]